MCTIYMNHSDFTPLLITQHNEYDHKTLYCLLNLQQNAVLQRPWGIQAIKSITPAEKSKIYHVSPNNCG